MSSGQDVQPRRRRFLDGVNLKENQKLDMLPCNGASQTEPCRKENKILVIFSVL